jgi:demethylmenaquinone methyltransferase/2-methoxy-6-polyprenyl-1,4-benzoquinol methylase
MLALAQRKATAEQGDPEQGLVPPSPTPNRRSPSLLAGDALRIPFGDGAFDAIVTGFALRNVTDIPAAFTEMARVTRPGGRLACLEIAKPSTPLIRQLTAFLTPEEIAEVMRRTGWQEVGYKRLMLGTVAVHVGVRKLEQA